MDERETGGFNSVIESLRKLTEELTELEHTLSQMVEESSVDGDREERTEAVKEQAYAGCS